MEDFIENEISFSTFNLENNTHKNVGNWDIHH